ncbi:MAG: ImmA/IrrE family metallo-endopeptidase [Chloroflexota bacterium]|nr:ImmA/IrrE family metallo-endopeptidase [Chloroflexota bacterium]
MSAPLWMFELSRLFWNMAGAESFPRNLHRPIARALPLSVVSQPTLQVSGVDHWLRSQEVICCLRVADRSLRACLLAQGGHGLIFVDSADPPNERRFSVAHELAHFLHDYWQPRRLAAERLGGQVMQVLDGERPPTTQERMNALLAGVPIGLHVHLMERATSGAPLDEAIARAERDADALACELLAPDEHIRRQVFERVSDDHDQQSVAAQKLLVHRYGLPPASAVRYARRLFPNRLPSDSLVQRLRVVR